MSVINFNRQGIEFERVIGELLYCFKRYNPGDVENTPGAVQVNYHTRIKLQNSEIVIPDYELICREYHIKKCYLIECQYRKRSSQDIVHKIRSVKILSNRNNFIFVYKDKEFLTDAVRTSLDNDGIMHYSIDEFIVFLLQLNMTMASISRRINVFEEYFELQEEFTRILLEPLNVPLWFIDIRNRELFKKEIDLLSEKNKDVSQSRNLLCKIWSKLKGRFTETSTCMGQKPQQLQKMSVQSDKAQLSSPNRPRITQEQIDSMRRALRKDGFLK